MPRDTQVVSSQPSSLTPGQRCSSLPPIPILLPAPDSSYLPVCFPRNLASTWNPQLIRHVCICLSPSCGQGSSTLPRGLPSCDACQWMQIATRWRGSPGFLLLEYLTLTSGPAKSPSYGIKMIMMEPVCKGFEDQIRIRNLDFNLWANSMTISLIKWTGREEDKKGEKEEKI